MPWIHKHAKKVSKKQNWCELSFWWNFLAIHQKWMSQKATSGGWKLKIFSNSLSFTLSEFGCVLEGKKQWKLCLKFRRKKARKVIWVENMRNGKVFKKLETSHHHHYQSESENWTWANESHFIARCEIKNTSIISRLRSTFFIVCVGVSLIEFQFSLSPWFGWCPGFFFDFLNDDNGRIVGTLNR